MAVPVYDHIVIVVMENHDYGQVIGDSLNAPYVNSLALNGALLSNYRGVAHPSEPNYLALYAGDTFGVRDDGAHRISGPTLATVLQSAGKRFAGYVERQGRSHDHNPWESFPEGRRVEQDFGKFPQGDLASLPTVSFVIPGVQHDMHDGTVAQGDAWLKANIGDYANWAKTHDSLLILAWDESAADPDNHVAAILYGAHVKPGSYPVAYNHYNILSTVLGAFSLPAMGGAATAPTIDVFDPAPSISSAMGKPITGEVAGSVALTSGDNPVSIAASGRITSTGAGVDGIDGPVGTRWEIVNEGTIASSGGLGVALSGAGDVKSGQSRGAAASITGAAAAVRIEQRPSLVANSGKIAAAGTGIDLRDGGGITNGPAASLHGDQFGVFITGAPGTVANSGTISGTARIGVDLSRGGSIVNAAAASIAGNVAGVFLANGDAMVANAGRINASGAAGVDIESGGKVENDSGASIAGGAFGVFVAGGLGAVTNQGAIEGSAKFGVDLTLGGSITNAASASIASNAVGVGVYGGQGRVTNQGTVSGGEAAVRFSGSGNQLVVGPAAVFNGSVIGGTTGDNTLELAGGGGSVVRHGDAAGSVTANGHRWTFSNFATLRIDPGGAWETEKSEASEGGADGTLVARQAAR